MAGSERDARLRTGTTDDILSSPVTKCVGIRTRESARRKESATAPVPNVYAKKTSRNTPSILETPFPTLIARAPVRKLILILLCPDDSNHLTLQRHTRQSKRVVQRRSRLAEATAPCEPRSRRRHARWDRESVLREPGTDFRRLVPPTPFGVPCRTRRKPP